MANNKISALTSATTPLAGTEVLPIVQSGVTTKVAVSNLTAGLTGTASININGTVGATTPSTGAFTTLSATNGTFSGYLTGSGTNPGGLGGSRYVLDFSSGQTRVFSYGANASTNGGFLFNSQRSNGSNSTNFLDISSSGIVTMSAYGAGAATFSAAGVISSVSDETWKVKDGVPTNTDAMLKKLEPGYWYYNDEKKNTFGADRQLGFYAQNVNAAIGPEAAPEPEKGKPWGYYDRSVLAVTVMSLQKALATIESLTARITALETK